MIFIDHALFNFALPFPIQSLNDYKLSRRVAIRAGGRLLRGNYLEPLILKGYFMNIRPIAAVILAAGLGKRMRSELPKVLHPVCGKAMIDHALDAVEAAGVQKVLVVTGHKGEEVQAHIGQRALCVDQPERLGTGHAVMQAEAALAEFDGDVIITYGDMPLIKADTYRRLIAHMQSGGSPCVMLTTILENARGYGRIVRDAQGNFLRIVEEKDCNETELALREVNIGLYIFDSRKLFAALKRVTNNNAQGEYYLTDVPEILLKDGGTIDILVAEDPTEMLGVNSREQLAEVSGVLKGWTLSRLMDEGVGITDPASTWIEPDVRVGKETIIEPFTVLRGQTIIGEQCVIGPNCEISNAQVGARVKLRHVVVDGGVIGDGQELPPFCQIKG